MKERGEIIEKANFLSSIWRIYQLQMICFYKYISLLHRMQGDWFMWLILIWNTMTTCKS